MGMNIDPNLLNVLFQLMTMPSPHAVHGDDRPAHWRTMDADRKSNRKASRDERAAFNKEAETPFNSLSLPAMEQELKKLTNSINLNTFRSLMGGRGGR